MRILDIEENLRNANEAAQQYRQMLDNVHTLLLEEKLAAFLQTTFGPPWDVEGKPAPEWFLKAKAVKGFLLLNYIGSETNVSDYPVRLGDIVSVMRGLADIEVRSASARRVGESDQKPHA